MSDLSAAAPFDLDALWARLATVVKLRFEATSQSAGGWNGAGAGTVTLERPDDETLLFQERGTWQPEGGADLAFSNVFRWTIVRERGSLRLAHLRFGPERPVELFELWPTAKGAWESVAPHVCREDLYSALLTGAAEVLLLEWNVIGPTKSEQIRYSYE